MEKDKPQSFSGGFPPPSSRYSGLSPTGSIFNGKSEATSSSMLLPPMPSGGLSDSGQFGHGMPTDSNRFSHDISRMPDNPPRNIGHRRAHSEILTLPDDICFDNDLGVIGSADGPSFSDDTEEDLLSMYLDMDKFNSSTATSTIQVGESSSAVGEARSTSTSTIGAATSKDDAAVGLKERPRVRHQHSQSMDGLSTIKPEMLVSGSEEASAADSKKAMSATKLAELALIDPKRAKRYTSLLFSLSLSLSLYLSPLNGRKKLIICYFMMYPYPKQILCVALFCSFYFYYLYPYASQKYRCVQFMILNI